MNKRAAEAQARNAARETRRQACPIPFTEDEWYTWESGEEEHVILLIKKYLRTGEQRMILAAHDITIEDCLNGRVEGLAAQEFVGNMFADWNMKLGYKHFGS